MSNGTKTTLVVELDKILTDKLNNGFPEDSPAIATLIGVINRAKKGDYHDFESEIDTPFPKIQLVSDLNQIPFQEIAGIIVKVKAGEYDEDPFEGVKNDSKDN